MGAEDFKEIFQTIRSASAINLYNIGNRLLLCKCYSSSKDQLPYRYLRNLFFSAAPQHFSATVEGKPSLNRC